MKKFEYTSFFVPESDQQWGETNLNAHGEEGWELVGITTPSTGGSFFYLKREKLEQPTENIPESQLKWCPGCHRKVEVIQYSKGESDSVYLTCKNHPLKAYHYARFLGYEEDLTE